MFIGVLILRRQIAAAVQVSYHGHSIRALTHYTPLSAAAGGGDGKDPLAAVNLSTCGAESAAVVLLGWACSVCQALQQGFKFRVEEVVISVGASQAASCPCRQCIFQNHRLPPPVWDTFLEQMLTCIDTLPCNVSLLSPFISEAENFLSHLLSLVKVCIHCGANRGNCDPLVARRGSVAEACLQNSNAIPCFRAARPTLLSS